MNDKIFVDTNILVYVRDSSESVKQIKAQKWLEFLWKNESGRLSTQVMNEYYVTVTQKLKPGLSNQQARSDLRALSVWKPLDITADLIEAAWDIQDKYQYSWWDSLIVTSALFLGCTYLLSEDMQHEHQVGDLKIINPFLVDIDALG